MKNSFFYELIDRGYTPTHISVLTDCDVVKVARSLISCVIATQLNNQLTAGIITETEAYSGENDKACHAYLQKKTRRNEAMFLSGGHIYIYLCYGLHHMLNIVTNKQGYGDAVLIRSIEPIIGEKYMLRRRNKVLLTPEVCSGPGNVCKSLGLQIIHNKLPLQSDQTGLFSSGIADPAQILLGKRIGVEYAGVDALKPWRFGMRNNEWISKPFKD